MKKHIFTFFLLLAVGSSYAENRSLEEMRAIAAAKLSAGAGVKSVHGGVKAIDLQCISNAQSYAVFAPAEGSGFVIVAKSDLVDPVIAYSTERFDVTNMPPAVRYYLAQASRTLEAIEAGRIQAPRRTASFTPVENFITTQWSQDYPFDRKTPNNYLAGCVATALAQCLNYCQYPASVDFVGSCSVTTKQGNKEKTENKTLHITTTYTWPYKNTYKSLGRYGDNIDELLRDCGYASYMQYSAEGSGTYSLLAGIALISDFQYPEACIKYIEKDWDGIDQETWNQMIYDELALRCPILYGAEDEVGGHAFIFSGVDEEGLVYVNWGWRGSLDGFYAIELLNPEGMCVNGFTGTPHMIIGIRPTPLATDRKLSRINGYIGDPYTFRWGTATDDKGVERHTLYCDIPYGLINWCPTNFQGVFGLFARDLTDGTDWVIAEDLQDRTTLRAGHGYFGDSEQYKDFAYYYYIDGEQGLKPGHTYLMAFGTKDDEEGIWHSISCIGGELGYEITYTGDPATSTVSTQKSEVPILTSIRNVNSKLATSDDGLTRVYDTTGRLVHTAPTAQFNLWDVPARGILIVKQGDSVKKIIR